VGFEWSELGIFYSPRNDEGYDVSLESGGS